jgi:hypothetical protein
MPAIELDVEDLHRAAYHLHGTARRYETAADDNAASGNAAYLRSEAERLRALAWAFDAAIADHLKAICIEGMKP